ncbi:Signal transduction histidine-protein kinase BarA [uncultured bacterium]|nr:Signal transduction histidine-protein kinase BarA [uncultured bacterium]
MTPEPTTNDSAILPLALLVEDNVDNRDVMLHFLKKLCRVDTCNNALHAIEMAKAKHYQLILMDINLGLGMNGMEATKIIRQLPFYDTVPIVAVTAYAMSGDKELFMDAGCTHYISKPFTKNEFVNLIAKILIKP